ncbi:MAG: radical SAM family heme chaperone HemW [Chloroflexota bacterium]|nr:radical SAM family heme chaperone HemW [Chloroflexota bacterium]
MTIPNPLSIYLHIPFCAVKCTYCAFNTYVSIDHLIPAFVNALCREITYVAHQRPRQPVWTIFFGGGTPSLLTPAQFAQILDAIRAGYDLQPNAEITFESNPADLAAGGRDYLRQLRDIGLNRISIGMQSANASELTLFNRRHSNDDVAAAVRAARAAGFDNLNLDLIYGVPHQTLAMWRNTLEQAVALQPEHLSLYALGIEDGTPMQTWVEGGRLPTPDDDLTADMYEAATDVLAAVGYDQYEISNWSKPGLMCRHNLQYWRNWDYLGFGPGAHGFAGGVRYAVMLSPQKYIRALEQAGDALDYPRSPAVETATILTQSDEIAETLIMSLRLLHEGVSLSNFRSRFGVDLGDLHGATLQRYADGGLLMQDSERVTLTTRGRLLSNMIFRDLV